MELEERILGALKQKLLTPEFVAEFSRAYQEECSRTAAEADGLRSSASASMASVQRKIDGIMSVIEDGLYQPSMKQRLAELEEEKRTLGAPALGCQGALPGSRPSQPGRGLSPACDGAGGLAGRSRPARRGDGGNPPHD